jgi:hypothetical protein
VHFVGIIILLLRDVLRSWKLVLMWTYLRRVKRWLVKKGTLLEVHTQAEVRRSTLTVCDICAHSVLAVRHARLWCSLHINSAREEFKAAWYTNTNSEFALERTLGKSRNIITDLARGRSFMYCTCSEAYLAGCHQVRKNQQQPEEHLRNTQNFSSYLTENTQRVRYEKQLAKAAILRQLWKYMKRRCDEWTSLHC